VVDNDQQQQMAHDKHMYLLHPQSQHGTTTSNGLHDGTSTLQTSWKYKNQLTTGLVTISKAQTSGHTTFEYAIHTMTMTAVAGRSPNNSKIHHMNCSKIHIPQNHLQVEVAPAQTLLPTIYGVCHNDTYTLTNHESTLYLPYAASTSTLPPTT